MRTPRGAVVRACLTHPARRQVREAAAVAGLFTVLLAVLFAPVVFGDRTFVPNGSVPAQSGNRRADYEHPRPAPVINDPAAFVWLFEPMAWIVHQAYADGSLPLWNPNAGLGAPIAANFQSAPTGPFYLPLFLHPTQRIWDFVILVRLLVGGLGCYALLRALRARPAAAIVAAS